MTKAIKTIVIHANCRNSKAKGDFGFAGNLAKDLYQELKTSGITDIDILLVSTLDGMHRFEELYGTAVDGRIFVEQTNIGLSSLEEFDPVKYSVVAFIDANRCKHAPAELIKRILSPESKFIFVGNVNQSAYSDLFSQALYRMQIMSDQPGLYDTFHTEDMLIGSAGLNSDRFGIPSITKAADLTPLKKSEQTMIPEEEFGFMYLAAVDSYSDYKLIAQYIKLSGQDKYILVGDFVNKKSHIQYAYDNDLSFPTVTSLPPIEYYPSLPNRVMRQMVAQANSSIVVSTGVTSTMEAMRDGKLPFYQNLPTNQQFVASYLLAVKSIISNDIALFGAMPQMIIELSTLLFADKPLSRIDMEQTNDLLKISAVQSRLVSINQTILDQASGKIAPRLLSFLGAPRKTNDSVQLASVCVSLRKPGEFGSPVHDQALRRAATWGRLFELKVLINSLSQHDLDKVDPTYHRSALHWAVVNKKEDCARALIQAGASLNFQDKEGQTPLHKAVLNGDRQMIRLLMNAGASLDIPDKTNVRPKDCAPDRGIFIYLMDCYKSLGPQHFTIPFVA